MMENNAANAPIQLRVRHQCIKYWSAGKHNMEKDKMRVISQSEARLFLPLRSKVIGKLPPFGFLSKESKIKFVDSRHHVATCQDYISFGPWLVQVRIPFFVIKHQSIPLSDLFQVLMWRYD